ncbi:ABC-F family ATP-binding cassette domain-containing protein [candidate division KSB1 bacterium]|nr:ABC-F family ATP-binding cassette domain-containing protein [candidate division KSB1 bacterium]
MKILIQINKLDKCYGHQVLFDQASITLQEKQKTGVIGRNGCGKSTLCNMITGEIEPDAGVIDKSSTLRLSYLEQSDPFTPDETVIHFLQRHTGKEEWECGKLAGKFLIKNELLDKTPIGKLSGGFQTRVKLTAMLLSEPNFLILDEPTNFLDLRTLLLLETFLRDYNGAFIIVSHDREFLMKTCKSTLEIENGKMTMFPGNVEEYLVYKEEKKELARQANINIEQRQKTLESFITRFKSKASKARQAQSKQKQIKRLEKNRIVIKNPLKIVKIRIPSVKIKKGFALKCRDMQIGYPEKNVASEINIDVNIGDKVAILGDNGQGKTTFMKTIAGGLPLKSGKYDWGYGLNVSYYAQHVYAELHSKESVYSYLDSKAIRMTPRQEILDLAGSFLFRGVDVEKSISILSGGERARLCLAGLLLSRNPVLILDEPTNHLDFETVEAFANALKAFNGTVFFVSHDRTFVNFVANKIIDIKDSRISLYPGEYEEYVYSLQQEIKMETEAPVISENTEQTISGNKVSYLQRKKIKSKINKIKNKIKIIETDFKSKEREKGEIEHRFSFNPASYTKDLAVKLRELQGQIEENETLWIELNEELSKLESQI